MVAFISWGKIFPKLTLAVLSEIIYVLTLHTCNSDSANS